MPAPFFEYRFSEDWVSENPATYLALLKGNRMFMRWKWAVLKADPRSGFWKISSPIQPLPLPASIYGSVHTKSRRRAYKSYPNESRYA